MIHIFNANGFGRMRVTPKMRKFFPTCDCKTFEVHSYEDGSYIYHRPKCKWLWYQRTRKPRDPLAFDPY